VYCVCGVVWAYVLCACVRCGCSVCVVCLCVCVLCVCVVLTCRLYSRVCDVLACRMSLLRTRPVMEQFYTDLLVCVCVCVCLFVWNPSLFALIDTCASHHLAIATKLCECVCVCVCVCGRLSQ